VRELFSRDPQRLGVQARRHVEQQYAWDTVVESLLGHYYAVLDSHKPMLAHG
jgi:alpha-1,6-mannosyltransferase